MTTMRSSLEESSRNFLVDSTLPFPSIHRGAKNLKNSTRMKSIAILVATVSPVGAFVLHGTGPGAAVIRQEDATGISLCSVLSSKDGDSQAESSVTPTASRRSFLNHAVTATATTTGTLLSSMSYQEPAIAATHAAPASTLAGQIELPPMGLGAWSWGDPVFWGYNPKNDDELKNVFDYAINNSKSPKTLLDTAELYGFGRSEELIGQFSKDFDESKIQVATKFAAFPFRTKATDVVNACEASMKRLGRPIDLYQIHFPNVFKNAEYWDGLAMAFDKGLVKAVGVSNYGIDATRACHEALAKRGIQLATNQIQMSLLYRWPEQNGLLKACDDLGIKVLSYSPLALGMLTGKYTKENPPQGPRQKIYEKLLTTPDYANLLATMKEVASGHGDATPSQVALNWARAKNTIPIPGARTLSQIKKNNDALNWNMSADEVAILDREAAKVTTFLTPDANPFPRKDINTGLAMYDS